MSQDFIPRSDSEFYTWEQTFMTYAAANTVAIGLAVGDLTAVNSAQGEFEPAYLDNDAKQNAAQAARQLKDDKRAYFEKCIRELVRKLQANKLCSDSEKQALGITVRDGTMTPATASATRPVGIINTSQRLRHEIRFFDSATPTKRAKPDGVMGCEIWVKIGTTPPTDPSECKFLGLDTASPYVAEFDGADAGKTAYYMLRWVTTRGEKGPWSETIAATIAG